ncbi:hypothetical protein JCM17823_06400 [Halorubrum gandharaense]
MPNQITSTGNGYALQVTKPARSAGLVDETSEGDTTYRADVVAYGFDGAICVIDADTDRVSMSERADLVAALTSATDSIHTGIRTRIQHSGSTGYRVQIPVVGTGLQEGDGLPCHAAPGVLLMAPLDTSLPVGSLLDRVR